MTGTMFRPVSVASEKLSKRAYAPRKDGSQLKVAKDEKSLCDFFFILL